MGFAESEANNGPDSGLGAGQHRGLSFGDEPKLRRLAESLSESASEFLWIRGVSGAAAG